MNCEKCNYYEKKCRVCQEPSTADLCDDCKNIFEAPERVEVK